MKPTEINRAIALLCGWRCELRPLCDDLGPIGDHTEECWYHDSLPELTKSQRGNWAWPTAPPNYYGSLDAMHEAEKCITDDHMQYQYVTCVSNLNHGGNGAVRWWGRWANAHATAAIKAQAFLTIHGKWTV